MPLRKDYIMRQFEEFGKVLGVLLGLKKEQDWEKFEKEIADATQKFISRDLADIEKMSDADFEKEILQQTGITQDQKKILANLLFEKLNFYLAGNDDKNYQLAKNKCLAVYTHLQQNFTEHEFDMDVYYKLAFLRKM